MEEFAKALREERFETAKALLDNGMAVDIRAERGWPYNNATPLHLACSSGRVDLVRELLKRGADIESVDEMTETPLQTACIWDELDVIRELLDHKANIEVVLGHQCSGPLHSASRCNRTNAIKLLLDRGANIESLDAIGRTPFLAGVEGSSEDAVDLLLERGANVHAVDSSGNTALHLACVAGCFGIMDKLLYRYRVDVNIVNRDGRSALMEALTYGCMGMIGAFLLKKASVHVKDNDGRFLVHCTSDVEAMTLILDAGADVDSRNKDGETALEIAAMELNFAMVKLLMSRGASIPDLDQLIEKINITRSIAGLVRERRRMVKLLERHRPTLDFVMK